MLIHIDDVKWFYLDKAEAIRLRDGRWEIHITLRGLRDFEYWNPRCWTQYRLCCTVDGVRGVYQFDDELKEEVLRYANVHHAMAHADHG